jgi:acyl carrier protein
MTRDAIRQAVIEALTRVAPEIDPSAIGPGVVFRQAFDLDSMDVLNFVIALHASLGVDVAEADYGKLSTLDATVDYLARRLDRGVSPPAPPPSTAGTRAP